MPHAKNENVRKQYGPLFDELSALLFRHDPIGINFDTNTDEYDPESRTILPRLASCQSESEVLIVVLEEFHRWFGDDINEKGSAYQSIAADIWNLWRQHSNRG